MQEGKVSRFSPLGHYYAPTLIIFIVIIIVVIIAIKIITIVAEAQKPSWHRGIAIRKVFARPESFCA